MEPCPHCNQPVDPQRHFVRGSLANLPDRLLRIEWPSKMRDRKFEVRCPHCNKTYVSYTLRRFGFVTRERYVWVVGAACLIVLAFMLIATKK